jgi:hypothetical protein
MFRRLSAEEVDPPALVTGRRRVLAVSFCELLASRGYDLVVVPAAVNALRRSRKHILLLE